MKKISDENNKEIDKKSTGEAKNKVVITRRSPKDVIKVCPICFSPVHYIGNVFEFILTYECTNPECGWKGNIAIEVSKEDYEKMKAQQKKKVDEQKSN